MKRFFAVWTSTSAYALDAYPEEVEPYRRALRSGPEHFAGPFDTEAEALAIAVSRMVSRCENPG